MSQTQAAPVADDHWQRHRFLAIAVEALALVAPAIAGVGTAVAVAAVLPALAGPGRVLWWVVVLAGGLAAIAVTDRIARRTLPLAVLLRMSLQFPDRAPSRFRVALRAGTTRHLDRQLHHLHHHGIEGDPRDAAAHILGLLAALARYDRRTRGHSERVRAFTDLIAEELRLSSSDRERLRWSALLHDIGKLHVDVAILNKPAALDEHEWDAIRSHPHVGAVMTAPLRPWLGEWATAIEHHHERWDGGGYPHGIAGDDIALGARIVAVADAFEVMTAARPYRAAAMPVVAAREELLRCAGHQFDPDVVRALLAVSLTRLRWAVGPFALLCNLPMLDGVGAVAGRPRLAALLPRAGAAALMILGVALTPHGRYPTAPDAADAADAAESEDAAAFAVAGSAGTLELHLADSLLSLTGPAFVAVPEDEDQAAPAAEESVATEAGAMEPGAVESGAVEPGAPPDAADAETPRRVRRRPAPAPSPVSEAARDHSYDEELGTHGAWVSSVARDH